MDRSLIEPIRPRMDARATQELVEIWQAKDTTTWSEEALYVVGEILHERGLSSSDASDELSPEKETATLAAHVHARECQLCGTSDYAGLDFDIVCAEVLSAKTPHQLVARRVRATGVHFTSPTYQLLETRQFFVCEQCVRKLAASWARQAARERLYSRFLFGIPLLLVCLFVIYINLNIYSGVNGSANPPLTLLAEAGIVADGLFILTEAFRLVREMVRGLNYYQMADFPSVRAKVNVHTVEKQIEGFVKKAYVPAVVTWWEKGFFNKRIKPAMVADSIPGRFTLDLNRLTRLRHTNLD